jgi:hypothetical protein
MWSPSVHGFRCCLHDHESGLIRIEFDPNLIPNRDFNPDRNLASIPCKHESKLIPEWESDRILNLPYKRQSYVQQCSSAELTDDWTVIVHQYNTYPECEVLLLDESFQLNSKIDCRPETGCLDWMTKRFQLILLWSSAFL